MELEVVSFKIAKLAKEAGFKEKTISAYVYRYAEHESPNYNPRLIHDNILTCDINAPTQELLRKWLREEHEIFVLPVINHDGDGSHWISYEVWLEEFKDYIHNSDYFTEYSTEEKALEAGLQKSLNYLLGKND